MAGLQQMNLYTGADDSGVKDTSETPVEKLRRHLQAGDIHRVAEMLSGRRLRDLQIILVDVGFTLPHAQSLDQFLTGIQPQIIAACKARTDGYGLKVLAEPGSVERKVDMAAEAAARMDEVAYERGGYGVVLDFDSAVREARARGFVPALASEVAVSKGVLPEELVRQPALENHDHVYTLEEHEEVIKAIRSGDLTADQLKGRFARFMRDKEPLRGELNAKTLKDLAPGGPGGLKKGQVVDRILSDMMGRFTLSQSVTWSMGRGSYEQAVTEKVNALTDQDLAKYAEQVRQATAERSAAIEGMRKAAENPETLDDFRIYIRLKKEGGMSFDEARMSLAPEQRSKFDELTAEESRVSRQNSAEARQTEVRVAAQTTAGQVIETKHTRTGEPLFVVKAAERVEREVYNQWNAAAKKLGGWYSSFRGNGAVPGFQFKNREGADAFVKYLGGEIEDAQEVAQARRDAFADDRSQSAVERLREMAARLEENADASLGQERKANTERRARMAANAEAAANGDKAMAQTMRNIADSIEAGSAKFLDRVRQKVQVEMLASMVRAAHYDEISKKYPSYADQLAHRGEPPTAETADYVRFPAFTSYRSDLARLGRELVQIDGAKLVGQRILKVADDISDVYRQFAKGNLLQVSTFRTDDGQPAVFGTEERAEDAIRRSGLNGKAAVVSFKRGEHRVVMGPEMARERGLWAGDDDKRITLTADFGEEIVAKHRVLGRANRISMPHIFDAVSLNLGRLKSMGIETPAELRAAIREFVSCSVPPARPDRVKELERAMVGRRNDGLDFFPTGPEAGQRAVDAAEIKPGMSVYEPSAGWGHLAELIRVTGVEPDVGEISPERRALLEAKGFNVVSGDFLLVRLEDTPGGQGYDRIIMNPPFSDRRDAEHVQHAYSLLKPNGRLVSIMGEGIFFGQDKKAQTSREWMERLGGSSEKLPEGSFLDPSLPVNTGVSARLVVIARGDRELEQEMAPAVSALHLDRSGEQGEALMDGVPMPVHSREQAVEGEVVTAEEMRDGRGQAAMDVIKAIADGDFSARMPEEIVIDGADHSTTVYQGEVLPPESDLLRAAKENVAAIEAMQGPNIAYGAFSEVRNFADVKMMFEMVTTLKELEKLNDAVQERIYRDRDPLILTDAEEEQWTALVRDSVARLQNEGVIGDGMHRHVLMTEPLVLYRSVSALEWEQIQKDGEIRGGLNVFNPGDPRREVFFGDTLDAQLIGQGEDKRRQAEYLLLDSPITKEFGALRERQKSIEAQITARLKERGVEPEGPMASALFQVDPVLKSLRAENRALDEDIERVREAYMQAVREKSAELTAADEKRGFSSVVLETRALAGGRAYLAKNGHSMMDGNEYGFASGAVKLSDIVRVRHVMRKQMIELPAAEAQLEQARSAAIAKPSERIVTASSVEKITDAGDELAYNKRNRLAGLSWDDIKDLNPTLRSKEAAKARVWPRPDYAELVANGMPPLVAHLVKQMYDGLPATAGAKAAGNDLVLENYVRVVGRVRDGIMGWAHSKEEREALIQAVGAQAEKRLAMAGRAVSIIDMMQDGEAVKQAAQVVLERCWPLEDGQTAKARFSAKPEYASDYRTLGRKAVLGLMPNLDMTVKALSAIKEGWPAKREAWQVRGYKIAAVDKIDFPQEQNMGKHETYWRVPITIDGQRRDEYLDTREKAEKRILDFAGKPVVLLDERGKIVGAYVGEEGAREAARELVAASVKREGEAETGIGRRKGGDGERSGPAFRAEGENITSERLMAEFGFRGVNFGNWVPQNERQQHLNESFDAFHDLAQTLGIPPRAISLGGLLGVAFGAQGGGKNLAHFVPGYNEINLTRTAGAGALAHEWAHGIDHYFATQASQQLSQGKAPYLSANTLRQAEESRMVKEDGGKWVPAVLKPFEGLRAEVLAGFKAIHAVISKRELPLEEIRAGRLTYVETSRKGLESWVSYFKRQYLEGTAEEVKARFGDLVEKMYAGDAGEYVDIGGGGAVPSVIAEVRTLVKESRGRVPSIDDVRGLAGAANSVRYAKEQVAELDAGVELKPETRASRYASDSMAADRGKGKPYWGTDEEMFARAFETYVYDTLALQNRSSPYLASGNYKATVYPQAEERQAVNAAFGQLFEGLRTRENEGKSYLYSIGEKPVLEPADREDIILAMMNDPRTGHVRLMGRLLAAGKIIIHDSTDDLPGVKEGAQGVTDEIGTVHLFAASFDRGEGLGAVVPVVMHEMFHLHGGGVLWGNLEKLRKELEPMYQKALGGELGAEMKAVAKRAFEGTNCRGDQREALQEFGAYLVQHAEEKGLGEGLRGWANKVIGIAKAWMLERFGVQVGEVTIGELQAVASNALAYQGMMAQHCTAYATYVKGGIPVGREGVVNRALVKTSVGQIATEKSSEGRCR